MEKKNNESRRVCVTGGAGFIGSWLVKELLRQGHVVHATLRNQGDESKTEMLRSFPGADTRLFLFEADIYDADGFAPAIDRCEFVFLVATPLWHNPQNTKYKNTWEAAVGAVEIILRLCERSRSVKRVIYTGSVLSASPMEPDGNGFKEAMDESGWTPLTPLLPDIDILEKGYTVSKTLAEKSLLSYNETRGDGDFEVVSLVCGLVGGDTLLHYIPSSLLVMVSQLTGDPLSYGQLKFLQEMLGCVPMVHISDVCEAHLLCMEEHSMNGRFICASAFPTLQDLAECYAENFPEIIKITEVEEPKARVKCTSTKLADKGFEFKYNLKDILFGSVETETRLGGLK